MTPSLSVLDTHTGGELTRIVMAEDLSIAAGSSAELLERMRGEFDWVRRSLTSEPRGAEFAVGAIVAVASRPGLEHSVVFFNNVGYLGMCGHGLIGVVEGLRYLSLIHTGLHRFDTPAGSVSVTLDADHGVAFTGVHSYCFRQDVAIRLDHDEVVVGDVAYGGNWFFIARDDSIGESSTDELMVRTKRIRDAIGQSAVTGRDGAEIDHVELYCSLDRVRTDEADTDQQRGCRNFVLCPGGHYDRSPCGTGTSAKLACLAACGELAPGESWIQESITGSRFVAEYKADGDGVRVTVKGRAHVIAEAKHVFDETDPLRFGIADHR